MSEPTPGPWIWWTSNSWNRLKRESADSENVLEPYVARDGHPDCTISEADMRLIAAAPDMLAALYAAEFLIAGIPDWMRRADEYGDEIQQVREAIAKATGSTQISGGND